MSMSIEQELLAQLRRMGDDQQRQVLEFARALPLAVPRGVLGKELLSFAGAIPPDELQRMEQAVQDACEKTDTDDW